MTPQLEQLRQELQAPLPHPDLAALRAMAHETTEAVLAHFGTLPDQPLGDGPSRAKMEALLREPPPEEGQSFAHVLAAFAERVAPHAVRVNHPRFLAFIPSAPQFVSVLGDYLCAGFNLFAAVWLEGAGPAQVEIVVLDWFKELLGFSPTAAGILTSGGSEANLTALVTARETLSWTERERAVLYLTEQRHWSMDRAAKIAGLRPEQLRPVAADQHYRLSIPALRAAIAHDRAAGRRPWMLVANAGATNTGAVDPLAEAAVCCHEEGLWLHVDAAYGWPAVLVPEEKARLAGLERADSLTLDPHKWFAQPFEAGCVLVREGHRLGQTFGLRPDYMQDVQPNEDEINFADHGLALTRRFRALKIWLSVKVLGLGWFRRLIRRSCQLAEFAQLLLEDTPGFEILCPRQLSIVCFRYVPSADSWSDEQLDHLNLALIDAIRATGRAFLSSTRLDGKVALRLCFVNWRTTAADVEEVIERLASLGAELAHERN